MVALQEEDEFWIGEVKSLDVNELVCHYWSTTGRNVATANFKPAYIGKSTGKTILTHHTKSPNTRLTLVGIALVLAMVLILYSLIRL
jgi:hypothetical protein